MTALHTHWTVRNSVSAASFSVRNLGFRTVVGTVPIRHATVVADEAGRPVRVEAELDLAGIDTGHTRRDHDLRQPRLLDTARFPTMRFDGGPARAVEGGGWTVPGTLRAHGRDVALELAVRGDAGHAVITAVLDRTDLGVRAPRIMIGRRIAVRIEAALEPVT